MHDVRRRDQLLLHAADNRHPDPAVKHSDQALPRPREMLFLGDRRMDCVHEAWPLRLSTDGLQHGHSREDAVEVHCVEMGSH